MGGLFGLGAGLKRLATGQSQLVAHRNEATKISSSIAATPEEAATRSIGSVMVTQR